MRHVGAEPARLGEAEQRVEVGPVDVHLAAGVVHLGAQLGDAGLVHAVRRRVGDHDRGELRRGAASILRSRSSRSTLPSASQATTTTRMPAITALAALVPCALDGIRQTSRRGLAVGPVVRPDRQQPGQLALRAGVGLHADRVVAGDLGQPALQLADQLGVPGGLRRPARTGACWRTPGQVIGSISVVALSFIVHEPSGIMPAVQRVVLVGQATAGSAASRSRSGGRGRPGGSGTSLVRRERGRDGRPRSQLGSASTVGHAERGPARPARCSTVVVSSQATPTRSASTRRRLTPRSAAAATTSAARPGTDRGDGVEERSVVDRRRRRRAARRRAARPCSWVRRRCARSPSGPW